MVLVPWWAANIAPMKRDRNRNLFALVLTLLLLGGGVMALQGTTMEKADFTFNNASEPESLDPKIVSGVPEGRVLRCLYEGLVNMHPKTLAPVPGMAERWEISKDRRTYTFHIRKNALWSNGDALTAKDFVYSWRRFLDPDSPAKYAQLLWLVSKGKDYMLGKAQWKEVGIRAKDPHTFVVELVHPTAYFLGLTSFYALFPVHRATVEAHPGMWFKPEHCVCNGPFLLHERMIRDRIRLRKNPRYWDADTVRLNTVDILPVEDHVTGLNLYLTGVIDWETDVPQQVIVDLMKRSDFAPRAYLGSYFYRVNVKSRHPDKARFLSDPRFRLALYLAMDRKSIVEGVTQAGETPARSLVPPGLPGYDGPKLPGTDLAKARALLAEVKRDLGVSEVPTLTILYNTSESHKSIAEVIQQQWGRGLGLDIKLENQEWGTYLNSQKTLDYDICRSAWIGDYPDPNTFLDLFVTGGGNNNTGYSDARYDALIDKAAREADKAKRLDILSEAESKLLEDLPILPIYYYVTKNLLRPWVKGFYPNIQNVHPLKFVWIDEKARREYDGR